MSEAGGLPNDVEALKRLILEQTAALEAKNAALESAKATLISQTLELEKLRFEIACLKRMKYGRSSEQLDAQIGQMQRVLPAGMRDRLRRGLIAFRPRPFRAVGVTHEQNRERAAGGFGPAAATTG